MHRNGWMRKSDLGVYGPGPPYNVGSSVKSYIRPKNNLTQSDPQMLDRTSEVISEAEWDSVIGQMEKPNYRHSLIRVSGRAGNRHSNGYMMNGESSGDTMKMGNITRRTSDRHKSGYALWSSSETGSAIGDVRRSAILRDPHMWLQFQHLSELIIEDEDGELKTLPLDVGGLVHLKRLTVKWGKIKTLPPSLAQVPLTYINLSQNRLHNLDGLESVKTLEVIDVSFNVLTSLNKGISQWKALKMLNVSGNKLKQLPDEIGSLNKIEDLNVSSNRLSSLPEAIGKLGKLKVMDVSMNMLSKLPESIGKLSKLIELRVSNNRISDIPTSIQNCRELRHVMLRKNRFQDVPKSLQPVSSLESLNICENSVYSMSCPIPSLRHLLLNSNNLTAVPLATLECHNLEVLAMEDNQIKELPPQIANLTSLRALYVSNNKIQEIPNELCRLTELRHLTLARTRVRNLPRNFDSLRRLSHLNLGETQITGELNMEYNRGLSCVMEYSRKQREMQEKALHNNEEELQATTYVNGFDESFDESD